MTSDPVLIVSADGHISAPPETYRDYIEERYLPALDDLVKEQEDFLRFANSLSRFSDEILDVIDEDDAIRSGGVAGGTDVKRRLVEMDREGVAAELVIPANQCAVMPFFHINNRPHPPELRAAGARAYHRWLADQVAQTNGRIIAMADAGPCLDMDESVAELDWIAEHGIIAIGLPTTLDDPRLPELYDPYYEPIWATCADHELVLLLHAPGVRVRQGNTFAVNERLAEIAGGNFNPAKLSEAAMTLRSEEGTNHFELDLSARQAMFQLMASGVFDRHPSLKLVLTELRADWVPETLRLLDALVEESSLDIQRKPSEYWLTNCFVTPSSIRPTEVELRHEIGVDRLMFGRDYPHPEGTWPNTHDWVRATLTGLEEEEFRAIMGENAIECFGLDRAPLARIATRIGPDLGDLVGEGTVAAAKIDHFDARSGFRKATESVDPAAIGGLLEKDLAALAGV